jgi:hypothetical protein
VSAGSRSKPRRPASSKRIGVSRRAEPLATLCSRGATASRSSVGAWSARGSSESSRQPGSRGVTPHVLRHTHATWGASAGVPITAFAARLGHADPRVTLRRYAHAAARDTDAAAERILQHRRSATGGRQDSGQAPDTGGEGSDESAQLGGSAVLALTPRNDGVRGSSPRRLSIQTKNRLHISPSAGGRQHSDGDLGPLGATRYPRDWPHRLRSMAFRLAVGCRESSSGALMASAASTCLAATSHRVPRPGMPRRVKRDTTTLDAGQPSVARGIGSVARTDRGAAARRPEAPCASRRVMAFHGERAAAQRYAHRAHGADAALAAAASNRPDCCSKHRQSWTP